MEEKIQQLKELFEQRAVIDDEIAKILGDGKKVTVKKTSYRITPANKNPQKNNVLCVDCGVERKKGKYFCKGRCSNCYQKFRRQDLKSKVPEQSKDNKNVKHYECAHCGEVFKSVLPSEEVHCPTNIHHAVVQK